MKLHRLAIENIASIEHAVIDFNDGPLADERLFLITGETGSGKSTIIDCLCLALYGNTPRMKAAKNARYDSNRTEDGKGDEMTTNNPRQLMRRGSVQAHVELTFEDNVGTPYVATWEVHRANNRIDGKISLISRSLQTADGIVPAHHYTRKNDIERHIEEIIGLDMDQFFRTVVLAQGKFAEFLNSDEKDKSDLLEKMTGTEIYTQVGKKIYEVCGEKENKCKILRGQMENITLLSDDQKAKISDEIDQLSLNLRTVDEQLKQASAMIQWLNEKNRINTIIAKTSEDLNENLKQTEAPDYQNQETLIKDWDATVEARHLLKEHQKATGQIKGFEQQKTDFQDEFDQLCADLRCAIEDINQKQKKIDETGQAIASQASNKAMYESIGEIMTRIDQWRQKNDNIKEYSDGLAKEEQLKNEAIKDVEKAKDMARQLEENTKELKKRQSKLDIADISNRIGNLNKTCRALESLKEKLAAVIQAETSLTNLRDKQNEDKGLLAQAKAAIDGKRILEEELRKNVNRATDWNELLIHAHNTLHQGDTCPICGNTITRMLTPKAESELEQLKTRHQQAVTDLQQTETQIQTIGRIIADNEKRITDAVNDLKNKTEDCNSHWRKTSDMLIQCGRNIEKMVDKAMADNLCQDIEREVVLLNDQLQQANELNKMVDEAQGRLDEATHGVHEAELRLNSINDSIKYQQKLIDICKQEAATLSHELDGLLVMSDWKERINDDFIRQLQADASAYQNLVATRQELSQFVAVQRTVIPTMAKYRDNITDLKDHGSKTAQVPENLEERWQDFAGRHVQWTTQMDASQQTATSTMQALNRYRENNPRMTLERLAEIDGHSQEEIDGIRKAHQLLNDSISSMKGALKTLTLQWEDLKDKKPDFIEDNMERLEELVIQKQEALNGLTTQIAEKKALLTADKDKAQMMQDKTVLLKQAEAEYLKWDGFNSMLGSADGSKFRRIAQSYILGELLANANGYLRQFNNRYELEAGPGSLIILVRDTIQGDLTSVTTLSGGESFMVSLALALALSGMTGHMFSVDTLFIDEGFGSLSPNYLDNVMKTLNQLYDMGGRRVGIISHVEMLKERVPTQIQVYSDPENNTVSRVNVVS